VISGAKVVDGSGNPWYHADIGISGDTIAAVGDLRSANAATRLDAHGVVAASWEPACPSAAAHGHSASQGLRREVSHILVLKRTQA